MACIDKQGQDHHWSGHIQTHHNAKLANYLVQMDTLWLMCGYIGVTIPKAVCYHHWIKQL